MLSLLDHIPGGLAPEGFFDLLDDSIIARVRDATFEGLEEGGEIANPVPFELLADYGDEETAERLRAWGHALGYTDKQIGRVGGFVWKVDAHHSPEMLLAYLRTDEWYDYASRLWALKKAIKLDVDRAVLRTALLTTSAWCTRTIVCVRRREHWLRSLSSRASSRRPMLRESISVEKHHSALTNSLQIARIPTLRRFVTALRVVPIQQAAQAAEDGALALLARAGRRQHAPCQP